MGSVVYEKRKILYIVEAMGGGIFTYIVDLANELADKYDICIAHGRRPQTPEDYWKYFDKRIRLIEVRNFKRSISPGKDLKALFEIKKIAREWNPDIIHLHSSKAGALGRLAFSGKKVPLFYTPHGYSFLMKNYSPVKRMLYKSIEAICGLRNCTTVSCSEGEHQESLKLTKRALCVNNGINYRKLERLIDQTETGKTEAEGLTVFTVGRICYQKNPSLFNEIALAMPDIRFLWIGDGELKKKLTAPNIEVTGWIKRRNALKQALYADIFILTSMWEGLPISLLEMMYMKKPCIVCDSIGSSDVIRSEENGFVCNTADEFVETIRRIQTDGCGSMVEKAYEDIINIYNISVMASDYDKIYRGGDTADH